MLVYVWVYAEANACKDDGGRVCVRRYMYVCVYTGASRRAGESVGWVRSI